MDASTKDHLERTGQEKLVCIHDEGTQVGEKGRQRDGGRDKMKSRQTNKRHKREHL